MLTNVKSSERRTFWLICYQDGGQWIHLGHLMTSRKEGERRLRWRQQWYPTAFLTEVHAEKCIVEDDNPLPTRSPKENPETTKVDPETKTLPRLRLVSSILN